MNKKVNENTQEIQENNAKQDEPRNKKGMIILRMNILCRYDRQ